MTYILPFHDPNRRRGFREGTGQVFYGRRLADHLQEIPNSPVERWAEWGRQHQAEIGFTIGFGACAFIWGVFEAMR